MKRKVFLMGVLALAVARFSLAQLSPGEYGREFTSSDDGTTQPYRLYVPAAINETSQALPLVVVLHGWGVDEFAWFKFTPVRRVADEFGFVVAAPYARGNWWYRGSAERDVLDMIRDVRKALRIDPRRIYLAGHSMGGWGTWYIGLRHPELFAAIAPMAGFDPAELVVAAANLSPFVIHDAVDPIVPVEQSRRPVARLAQQGISHVYREEIGYGHASRMIGDNLRRVLAWFVEHPREAKPRRVALAARVGGQRDRWFALCAPEMWPRLAIVDALIDSEGRVAVRSENVRSFAVSVDDLPASATRPLRLVVNGRQLVTSATQGWVVATLDQRCKEWRWQSAESLPEPPTVPPLRGKAAAKLVAAHANDALATAVAELLREHFATDGCVLDADKIRIGKGALSPEKLLDAWVYPEERLIRVQIPPAKLSNLGEVISKGRALVVPEKLAQSKQKAVTIVCPLAVARQAGLDKDKSAQVQPYTIGELLAGLATQAAWP
ncbi:MAG: PHB depolymerase family esterase [Candidatus Sumerlaeaceae bacterium]